MLILTAVAIIMLVFSRQDLESVFRVIDQLGPISFFAAFAILPAIGLPITPFLLLAGAGFGIWWSLLGTGISIAINLILCYWLSQGVLRQAMTRLLRHWHHKPLPHITPENAVEFTILMKLAPGIPTFLKNYILGLAGVPFWTYFSISWIFTMLFASGVIILGDSIKDGQPIQAVIGAALLILVVLALRYVRRRWQRREGDTDESATNH